MIGHAVAQSPAGAGGTHAQTRTGPQPGHGRLEHGLAGRNRDPVASDGAVVLSRIADAGLSGSVERAAAAAGVRLVATQSPTRRNWLAAAAIIVDEAGARRCVEDGLPRRDSVLLVGAQAPSPSSWSAAITVGAENLCTLPAEESRLLDYLSGAVELRLATARRGPVVAVTAGRGGAGASVFASALARSAGEALLVDLDPIGGGIDLLLGGESAPGLRWPDLGGDGGRLGWAAVRDALPRQGGVYLMSGTRTCHEIAPDALAAVMEAGRRGGVTVVCDVPRQLAAAAAYAAENADLLVVLTTCDVRAIAAAAAWAGVLRAANPNVGLVVRGPAPGGLRAQEAAEAVGIPLLAAMRPEPRLAQRLERGGLRLRRRSPLTVAARAVLEVLPNSGGREPAARAA